MFVGPLPKDHKMYPVDGHEGLQLNGWFFDRETMTVTGQLIRTMPPSLFAVVIPVDGAGKDSHFTTMGDSENEGIIYIMPSGKLTILGEEWEVVVKGITLHFAKDTRPFYMR